MIAQNLDDAYRAFDPLQPLAGESLQTYYVAREPNPIDRIRSIFLRTPEKADKILFTGHRGCGKSTELNRLLSDPEIQQTFLVVRFSLADILDPLDLSYIDLLVAIEAGIYRTARQENVLLGDAEARLLANFWVPQARPIGFIEERADSPIAQMDRWFEMLVGPYGKLGLEAASRDHLRKVLANRVSDLVSHIAILTGIVRARLERNVLVAIDDLDKPDIATAQELFYRHSTTLTQPPCKILYTIPIAILYTAEFRSVARNFAGWLVLPNVKVWTQEGSPHTPGRQLLQEMVHRRMASNLIEPEALDHLVTMSGGVMRELTTLMQMACNEALVKGIPRITPAAARQAVAEVRNEYQRSLRTEHYRQLQQVHEDKRVREIHRAHRPPDEERSELELLELLHNLSILEYSNEESWWDVHPIVASLL